MLLVELEYLHVNIVIHSYPSQPQPYPEVLHHLVKVRLLKY